MTYRNRMKKPKSNKGLGWNPQKYFEKHKIPYLAHGYSDSVDPVTGKFFGYHDYGFKNPALRKQVRREGKCMIDRELTDMFDDPEESQDNMDDCEYLDGFEEEEALWADEAENYRQEMKTSHLQEDYNAKWDIQDDPFDFRDEYSEHYAY